MKKNLGSLLMVSKECQSPKMYDEIKEIIKFQDILNYYKAKQIEPVYCEELITTGELQSLLDYITNLQTIQKEYDYLLDEVARLENEKEINKYKTLKDLQDRIDKAICYLANCDWNNKKFVDLYDILQGSDKEWI